MKNYRDIIDHKYEKSKKHPHMSIHDRAAQFAPFAALTGYDAMVGESARYVDTYLELEEEEKEQINQKLNRIKDNIQNHPFIQITYFLKDERKEGGEYLKRNITLKRIDEYEKMLITDEGERILFENIFDLQGDIFKDLDRF